MNPDDTEKPDGGSGEEEVTDDGKEIPDEPIEVDPEEDKTG